jgi:hypothetical protein
MNTALILIDVQQSFVHRPYYQAASAAKFLERTNALATTGVAAYAQIKRAWNAPVIEAIQRTHEHVLETWLDTWYSDEGQQRLRATVARLGKKS